MCYFSITMLKQQREGTPASLLVVDEGLLQEAAGLVPRRASLCASPTTCNIVDKVTEPNSKKKRRDYAFWRQSS